MEARAWVVVHLEEVEKLAQVLVRKFKSSIREQDSKRAQHADVLLQDVPGDLMGTLVFDGDEDRVVCEMVTHSQDVLVTRRGCWEGTTQISADALPFVRCRR